MRPIESLIWKEGYQFVPELILTMPRVLEKLTETANSVFDWEQVYLKSQSFRMARAEDIYCHMKYLSQLPSNHKDRAEFLEMLKKNVITASSVVKNEDLTIVKHTYFSNNNTLNYGEHKIVVPSNSWRAEGISEFVKGIDGTVFLGTALRTSDDAEKIIIYMTKATGIDENNIIISPGNHHLNSPIRFQLFPDTGQLWMTAGFPPGTGVSYGVRR